MQSDHVDVLIIGAGLAGIGFAWHLQNKCPGKSYRILEARHTLGGTWDLFKYPGIRSDSDMYTYSYSFKPWIEDKAIAPAELIMRYMNSTVTEEGIDQHIQYNSKVKSADWSSEHGRWTVTIEDSETGALSTQTCNWVQMCAGYYSYKSGYAPEFPGSDSFTGDIIHPQNWPEGYDYSGKRIVVIGSGATAVTLIPNLVDKADHVVMLQRSPTYIFARPDEDVIAKSLRAVLPQKTAYALIRKKNIFMQRYAYKSARKDPAKARDFIMQQAKEALPEGYDAEKHFSPDYNPWDQRVCVSPNGDIFDAISKGKASVVTDHIDTFTADGIRLKSGEEIKADVIVTATGLDMVIGGDATYSIDGKPVDLSDTWIYKGMMFSGLPNIATTNGTVTASYTLRVELVADYACRLINHMDENGASVATPTLPVPASDMPARPFVVGFNSGYLLRAMENFPKQGDAAPWINPQEFRENKQALQTSSVNDGHMVFSNPATEKTLAAAE
jgi:cation diffusion facilitator CzcD-associated flavoprotein CzcO